MFNPLNQQAAGKASKIATDALWAQESGTNAYSLAGKILLGCGVIWGLLPIIPILCNEPIQACLWMWVLAAIQVVAGIILIALSARSKSFRKWANKDFEKDKQKIQSR